MLRHAVDLTCATQRTIAFAMKKTQLYADGACQGNPGPGGYGTVLLFGEHRKELSGGYRKTTNNRMELTAVIKGLEALKEKCEIEVYSDSKYVVDALSKGWAARWRANGWRRNKKERALNPELWGRLLALCEAHEVTFHWVKGHSGNPENERCDQLASEAATQPDLPPDNPYVDLVRIPIQPETPQPVTANHEASLPGAAHIVRKDLDSPDGNRRKKAIFKAVKEKLTELVPDLIQLMKSEKDPDLKSRCAWALGRLDCQEAEPSLIAALNDQSEEVRTWSAWALGEIGNTRTKAHLQRALAREGLGDVQQAIGGALKKLNYDSTRTHVSELEKALQPPEAQDPTLVALMKRLEKLKWKTDREEIVAVRAEMMEHNPDFFDSYMSWVRRKPEITVALEDGRKVYS